MQYRIISPTKPGLVLGTLEADSEPEALELWANRQAELLGCDVAEYWDWITRGVVAELVA